MNLRSSLLGMEWDAATSGDGNRAGFFRNLADAVMTDGDRDRLQQTLDEEEAENERLKAERAAIMAVEPDEFEIAYQAEMAGWEDLNKAVGGDLWDNPEKLAIMRSLDTNEAWENFDSFDDFHDAVVEAINGRDPAPAEEFAL